MTSKPVATSRRTDRRRLLLGAAVVGLGAVIGHARPVPGTMAQASALPGASLTEMATYTGWRRTWDLVVPVRVDRAFPRTFLLYDRNAGEAKLIVVDAAGGFREARQYVNWKRTWTTIIASGFPRTLGVTGLIAYDRINGVLDTLQTDQFGNVDTLQSLSNWRRTWSAFVPIGTDGFLAYDRTAGYASLFGLDTAGNVREIRSFNDWRETWDLITTGPFTSGAIPSGDLLLYDRGARQAEGLTMQGTGQTVPFASYSGWRQSWTSIQGGAFFFRGSQGSGTADLMLFDQIAQELEFIDIGPGSALTSLLLTSTPGARSWTTVAAVGPDLVFLYDRTNGVAAFSTTSRAPIAPPTPTRIPPTPTPIPPTPTPPIVQAKSVTVRLQQGRGNAFNSYSGKSDNPKGVTGKSDRITGVRNTADKRIALIHRDKSGKRTGPMFLKAKETSHAFDGMGVGGDWDATITGSQSEAPARIALEVSYEFR